jgi:drug/metabolite transporter (DMT)-like permease
MEQSPVNGPISTRSVPASQRSTWLLVLAALLFATMALCAKFATRELPVPEVVCLRFLFGMLSVVVPLGLRLPLRPHSYRALSLRGILGGLSVLAYFAAIAHLPVGIATLLNYSFPLFVALFSTIFLHEPLGPRAGFAFLLTSLGIAMVVLGNAPAHEAGREASLLWALCGIGSAVLSGGAVTTVRSMRNTEGSWEIFLSFSLFGFLLSIGPTLLKWVTPSLPTLCWLIAMGIASVGAQVLMTYSLRDVPAVRAGLLLQLTPIAAFVLGVVLLHDRPRPLGLLGAVVTLFGVTWGALARRAGS